jgi:hypothetical protein
MMKKAVNTFENDYYSLNVAERIEITRLVKVPREEWTLEQRDLFMDKLIKEEGITYTNYQEKIDLIMKNMPSILTKDDVTNTFVPNLYERSLSKIYKESSEHKDLLWNYYNEWRVKNRILEHRRAMKSQTT